MVEPAKAQALLMPINLYLACHTVVQTKAFYEEIGFDVFDSAMQTCTARIEDCCLIFFEQDAATATAAPGCSGTIYLFIKDVDARYSKIKDIVEPEWPLQDMSYGTREFAIADCNGYRLAFAQSHDS